MSKSLIMGQAFISFALPLCLFFLGEIEPIFRLFFRQELQTPLLLMIFSIFRSQTLAMGFFFMRAIQVPLVSSRGPPEVTIVYPLVLLSMIFSIKFNLPHTADRLKPVQNKGIIQPLDASSEAKVCCSYSQQAGRFRGISFQKRPLFSCSLGQAQNQIFSRGCWPNQASLYSQSQAFCVSFSSIGSKCRTTPLQVSCCSEQHRSRRDNSRSRTRRRSEAHANPLLNRIHSTHNGRILTQRPALSSRPKFSQFIQHDHWACLWPFQEWKRTGFDSRDIWWRTPPTSKCIKSRTNASIIGFL